MRKIFSTMMLVAAAAMAFVSCQKETAPSQVEEGYISFTSANPDTKTEWNGETIVWSVGDAIRVACQNDGVWYTSGDPAKAKLYASEPLSEGAGSVQFKVKTGSSAFPTDLKGSLQFYALYPSATADASFDQNTSCETVKIKAKQEPSSSTYDSSCDIMWGKATTTYASIPTSDPVSIVWHRVVAHANISLNKIPGLVEGEKINTITLTAQEDAALVGTFDLNMATGEFTATNTSNTITITSDIIADASGNISFWACINPCTLTELDIVVDTDKASYTIQKSGFTRMFLVNQRNLLPINMSGATRTEKVIDDTDYSGEWLITGKKNDVMYAAKAYEASNSNLKSLVVILQNETFTAVEGIQNCKMTITKVTEGEYAGRYTITDANGLYLCSGTSTSSSLKGKDVLDEGGYWSISQTEGVYKLVSASKETHNEMRFNSASNSLLFNCYQSTSTQSAVTLYPFSMVVEDTTPKITVESNAIEVAADAQSTSFTYTVNSYVTGPISVDVSEENKTISGVDAKLGENNTVNVTFDANNDATEKSATIVLSYDGAESVTVTITQAAKPAADAVYYVKVTSAPSDWSGQYILVYANGDSAEILTSEYSSSFFKVKNISLGDCGVLASDITEDCILTISKVTGGYNLRIGSSYISYGGSSTNLSSSTAVPTENNGIWTINLTSQGNATITNVGTTTRFLKYNTAASANRFAAYTSSTGKAVQLYKLQSN